MQEITKAKCSSSSIPVGTEGRLKDTRDNKIYWVAKLKDGLCWMTQNLDYDGGAVSGYDGDDAVTLIKATSFTDSTRMQLLYYDPGEYVYTEGSTSDICNGATISTGLSGCVNNGWIDANELRSNWIVTDDNYFVSASSYVGSNGQSICDKEVGSIIGNDNYNQCKIYYGGYEHYLAGNYYNWQAATNGIGGSAGEGATINQSICPVGWSLPTSNNTNIGSYSRLLNGLASNTSIAVSPYFFVYGGYVSSALSSVGGTGQYWSATTGYGNTDNAFALNVSNTGFSVLASNARYVGLSVRCVAR